MDTDKQTTRAKYAQDCLAVATEMSARAEQLHVYATLVNKDPADDVAFSMLVQFAFLCGQLFENGKVLRVLSYIVMKTTDSRPGVSEDISALWQAGAPSPAGKDDVMSSAMWDVCRFVSAYGVSLLLGTTQK